MSRTTFSGGLGYEGKVTLTLKSNNRVLTSKTYNNHGTVQLFRFLGFCLTDSYEEAKNLLPNKILLLHNTSSSPIGADPTAVEQCTDWHTYVQAPTIISANNSSYDSQVKVIYSFEVPKNAIDGNFNQVALYGAGITDIRDFSAYYFLTDSFGNNFENTQISTWSATTVLLIEWELSLSNKNVEINNT